LESSLRYARSSGTRFPRPPAAIAVHGKPVLHPLVAPAVRNCCRRLPPASGGWERQVPAGARDSWLRSSPQIPRTRVAFDFSVRIRPHRIELMRPKCRRNYIRAACGYQLRGVLKYALPSSPSPRIRQQISFAQPGYGVLQGRAVIVRRNCAGRCSGLFISVSNHSLVVDLPLAPVPNNARGGVNLLPLLR
jgi:hypothetical protein